MQLCTFNGNFPLTTTVWVSLWISLWPHWFATCTHPHCMEMWVLGFTHMSCDQQQIVKTIPAILCNSVCSYGNVTWSCGAQGKQPNTVLPEIFARLLFLLNFAVGVGPRKLNTRNFLRTQKFRLRGIYCQLHVVWFPRHCGAVASFNFLLSRQARDDVTPSIFAAGFK